MKKNAPKKLVIHRETLRNLDRATVGARPPVSTDMFCTAASAIGGCPTMGIYTCGCEPTGLEECSVQLFTDTNCAC